MRVLFDQGTPVPIRQFLTHHSVRTAKEQQWTRLENGQLWMLLKRMASTCC